jgi:hypothetical protein
MVTNNSYTGKLIQIKHTQSHMNINAHIKSALEKSGGCRDFVCELRSKTHLFALVVVELHTVEAHGLFHLWMRGGQRRVK